MTPYSRRTIMMALSALALILSSLGQADTTRDASPAFVQGTTSNTVLYPEYSGPHAFRAWRADQPYQSLRYRDLELMWDEMNIDSSVVWRSEALDNTLWNYAHSLVGLTGTNPFGAPYSKIRWLYEYFRSPGHGQAYDPIDPRDSSAMVVGLNTEGVPAQDGEDAIPPYNLSDRSHVDVYLWNRDRIWHDPNNSLNHHPLDYGGQYPSMFISGEEDSTTGHAVADTAVMHSNSIMVESPLGARRLDTTGNDWTNPDSLQCLRFSHEFRHSLPGTTRDNALGEMFSAGAEAVAGNQTPELRFPMAYTWPLTVNDQHFGPGALDGCSNLRYFGQNYQGRSLFAAYLAYDFRGADTSATLSGIQDDLLHRWATRENASWSTLRDLLNDDSCATCATYFPEINDTLRFALLLHNWRIANYVNNPALAQHQYGYQVDPNFSPARQVGAWQAFPETGNCRDSDHVIIVPPEVTLSDRYGTRDTVLRDERSYNSVSYPLVLQPFGSEYWIVRSDPTSQRTGQDLAITVYVDSIGVKAASTWCGDYKWREGRLFASAIGYREQSINGVPQPLWAHPEWASVVIEPQWTDVDSAGAVALHVVVPGFGDGVKAVVVVLSMADGRSQYYTESQLNSYEEVASYRLGLGLRYSPFAAQNPVRLDWLSNDLVREPSFSPDGDQLAYTRRLSGRSQIYTTSLSGRTTALLEPEASRSQDQADWSPRGDWVAYRMDRARDLFPYTDIAIHNVVTQETRWLTCHGNAGCVSDPAFSPDGQQVAYVLCLPHSVGEECDGVQQVRRIDLTGQRDTVLAEFHSPHNAIVSLRWGPAGRWVWFSSGDSLYRVRTDGGMLEAATAMAEPIASTHSFDLHRGSGSIVIEQADAVSCRKQCMWLDHDSYPFPAGYDSLVTTPFRRIALRDTLQRLPLPQFQQRNAIYSDPRWSYDGTRIAYASDEHAIGSASDIYVGQVSWNHAPYFVNAPRDTVLAGSCNQTLTQTYSATDPDGEGVTFSAAYLPSGASLSAAGEFSWPNPPAGSEHFVVVRALDGSGGVAQKVIRIAIEPDSLRPAASEVVPEMGHTSAAVGWVAPGDDSLTGTACRSRVAYSTSTITEGNFFSCDTLATGAPGESGTLECALAPNGTLSACTWYYFAVKTQDDAGHWSALSNVASGKTTCSGSKIKECNTEDLMAQGGGEMGWHLENSVLEQATTTAPVTDVYALRTPIAAGDSVARVRLSYPGSAALAVKLAGLAVVDHKADVQAFTCKGKLLLGEAASVYALTDGQQSLSAVIDSSEDSRMVATGTTWEVTLAEKEATGQALLVELAGRGTAQDSGGVEVQVPAGKDEWTTVEHLRPRAGSYAFVVDSLDANAARLLFHQECEVRRLAWVKPVKLESLSPLAPSSAVHSTQGDATTLLASAEAGGMTVQTGESVVLTYELKPAEQGLKRDAFLVLRGARTSKRAKLSRAQAAMEARATANPLPTEFALHPNQPNPVTAMTLVRFDLPRPSSVRLEVFDLQGRRIAKLADGVYPAGYHQSTWDGRMAGGSRVRAGMYICRLQAGAFQAQRKMILVK